MCLTNHNGSTQTVAAVPNIKMISSLTRFQVASFIIIPIRCNVSDMTPLVTLVNWTKLTQVNGDQCSLDTVPLGVGVHHDGFYSGFVLLVHGNSPLKYVFIMYF